MTKIKVISIIPILGVFAWAFAITGYSQENATLLEKINRLENELAAVKSQISSTGTPVLSSLPIKMYGYIKVDAVYSDSGGNVGNSALQMNAPVESDGDKDDFVIDGRETRLGFALTGVELDDGGTVTGKIETDFWGDSTGASARLRLRQAFIKLSYPQWSVLAGQTWDFFSPLGPKILNFAYLWRSGNLGDRHPQIIFTRKMGNFTAQVGMIDSENSSQENSGGPVGGVYLSYKNGPLYLGIGGIMGEEDVTGEDVSIWAGTFAWQYAFTPKVSMKGEAYIGSTLNSFRGGSAYGTYGTATNVKGVRARGGWAQLSVKATDKLAVNVGGGIDDVIQDRITDPNGNQIWNYNYSYFINFTYAIMKNLIWGMEFQRFITDYALQASGDANRYQTSLIYKF